MIEWHENFCEGLAGKGHYVIRFDNRDVGLSYKFEEMGLQNIMKAAEAFMQGETVTAPYTLEDMAGDAVGLLDALDIDRAHICGMSMAVMAQENRKPALASVTVPTLVIHGSDDPLVPLACGKDTADAIPGAELLVIEGMGHDLPPGSGWPQILDAIVAHTKKAQIN